MDDNQRYYQEDEDEYWQEQEDEEEAEEFGEDGEPEELNFDHYFDN